MENIMWGIERPFYEFDGELRLGKHIYPLDEMEVSLTDRYFNERDSLLFAEDLLPFMERWRPFLFYSYNFICRLSPIEQAKLIYYIHSQSDEIAYDPKLSQCLDIIMPPIFLWIAHVALKLRVSVNVALVQIINSGQYVLLDGMLAPWRWAPVLGELTENQK